MINNFPLENTVDGGNRVRFSPNALISTFHGSCKQLFSDINLNHKLEIGH